MKKAFLILEDGTVFKGTSIGSDREVISEIVFNTSMTGYLEVLTDPSYAGQAVTMTYPLIGNYGIPKDTPDEWGICTRFESEHIHVRGLVIAQYSEEFSHYDAVESLSDWLKKERIPGLSCRYWSMFAYSLRLFLH